MPTAKITAEITVVHSSLRAIIGVIGAPGSLPATVSSLSALESGNVVPLGG